MDIKTVVLKNGSELIGKAEVKGDTIFIEKPLFISPRGLMEWPISGKHQDVELDMENVLHVCDTQDEPSARWNETYGTKLVVPPKDSKLII